MNREEVLKLAKLARIELSDTEADALTHEFEGILAYVSEVKDAGVSAAVVDKADFPHRNALREDITSHESGLYTDAILEEAPQKEGSYIKVKKIL